MHISNVPGFCCIFIFLLLAWKMFRSQQTMGTHNDAINLIIPGRSYNGSSPVIKNLNSFMCKNLFKGAINQLYLHIRMDTILQKSCSFKTRIPVPSQCLHLSVCFFFTIYQKTLNTCHISALNLQSKQQYTCNTYNSVKTNRHKSLS